MRLSSYLNAISITVVLVLVYLVPNVSLKKSLVTGDTSFLDIEVDRLVKFMGYKSEIHEVYSKGYVIRLTRMINPLAKKQQVRRTILFLHGLVSKTASNWLGFAQWAKPEKPGEDCYSKDIYANISISFSQNGLPSNETLGLMCLPCTFSNNNYDVWLMDERGNTEGSRKVTNSSLLISENYWDFSFDPVSLEDLPRVINYVTRISKRPKLTYVGVSKGTTHMFGLLSSRKEYANKLDAYVAIDPVFYGDVEGSTKLLGLIEPFVRNMKGPVISPGLAKILSLILLKVCEGGEGGHICRLLSTFFIGPDITNGNLYTDVNLSNSIGAVSSKTMAQIGQAITSGKATMFDYGDAIKNFKAYGQIEPPEYDLSRIHFKRIILVRGDTSDFLSTRKIQERIIKTIRAPIFKDIVVPPYYNHLSLLTHKNALEDVMIPTMRAVNEAFLV